MFFRYGVKGVCGLGREKLWNANKGEHDAYVCFLLHTSIPSNSNQNNKKIMDYISNDSVLDVDENSCVIVKYYLFCLSSSFQYTISVK